MTRQEEIDKAADGCFNMFHIPTFEIFGFKLGANWADENPKSPWISVKEGLPCDNPNNIHFGFTNRVFATNGKDVFIAYMKKDKDDKWTWCTDDDNVAKISNILVDPVTYWMLIPKIPSTLIPKLSK